MRTILGAYLQTPPDSLEIDETPAGKPYLRTDSVHFNLSHSQDIALVAVANAPVGVDLEHPREFRAPDRFAKRICNEREYASLQRAGGDRGIPGAQAQLLRLWVRKEAVVKGTGEGLGRPVDEVDVLDDAVADGWLCVDLPSPAAGFQAALAVQASKASVLQHRFAWDDVTPRRFFGNPWVCLPPSG
jgi:4'-phosphopantetheinyl transferase